ncbi:hypothetical protein EFN40_09650 [Pediococcus parvulus]|nr:hypothetical protein [Pediococcus parvulus]
MTFNRYSDLPATSPAGWLTCSCNFRRKNLKKVILNNNKIFLYKATSEEIEKFIAYLMQFDNKIVTIYLSKNCYLMASLAFQSYNSRDYLTFGEIVLLLDKFDFSLIVQKTLNYVFTLNKRSDGQFGFLDIVTKDEALERNSILEKQYISQTTSVFSSIHTLLEGYS